MTKTAARFTLADIARATRAAKEQGAEAVEILPDGTIRVIIAGVQHKDEAKPEAKRNFRDFKL
jgi:class 3 adenylate cyclase